MLLKSLQNYSRPVSAAPQSSPSGAGRWIVDLENSRPRENRDRLGVWVWVCRIRRGIVVHFSKLSLETAEHF